MAFYSGKDGSISIGGTTQKFTEWTMEVESSPIPTTNFGDGGYQTHIQGLVGAKWTAKGPFDPTIAKQVAGTTGTVVLTVGSTYAFSFSGIVQRCRYSQDINNGSQIEMSGVATGSFDLDLATVGTQTP